MDTKTKRHGGPGRGQGRKPLKEGEGSVIVPVRMTSDQQSKLKRLGGPKWVRTKIDEAPEPEGADAKDS